VRDRPRVCAWLGKIKHRYGQEGYPMLRIVASCETGTCALLGAVFGPVADCETDYAGRLLSLLDDSMLLLDDRGFDADDFLAEIAATGAQPLVRLNSRRAPARWALLPDGSYLTRISGVRLRIIDAHITVTTSDGMRLGGQYRLATTLLDHRHYPAAELVALYPARSAPPAHHGAHHRNRSHHLPGTRRAAGPHAAVHAHRPEPLMARQRDCQGPRPAAPPRANSRTGALDERRHGPQDCARNLRSPSGLDRARRNLNRLTRPPLP
jgi:hypothetical protein